MDSLDEQVHLLEKLVEDVAEKIKETTKKRDKEAGGEVAELAAAADKLSKELVKAV
jgi:hypothetical protein